MSEQQEKYRTGCKECGRDRATIDGICDDCQIRTTGKLFPWHESQTYPKLEGHVGHVILVDDIFIEFNGTVVARLGKKRIRIFARDAAEIMNDGRIVYKKPDGKWYWEIKP